MSAGTRIEWTDRTWNPIVGCTRVSAGCENCYAERMAARLAGNPQTPAYHGLVRGSSRGPRWTGDVRFLPDLLEHPLHWRKPQRVFVNSMSDLFHERVSFDVIVQIFATMARAERHTFQVLTKRPARMREFMTALHDEGGLQVSPTRRVRPHNVHVGVSVEDQATADERIPELLGTPAALRFVSYEPALGPVDFRPFLACTRDSDGDGNCYRHPGGCPSSGLGLIIVGGESGPGARHCDIDWIRDTIEICRRAHVACFVKQLGRRPVRGELAVGVTDYHGGDPREWPADLRVREMPRG